MHFHLPKPLHGWREFVGEIAIIVIGVLIALAAENLIERWHWNEKAEIADAAFKVEIFNAGLNYQERLIIQPSLQDRIRALAQVLAPAAQRWRASPMIMSGSPYATVLPVAYRAPSRLFPVDGWRSATANGTLDHLPQKHVRELSGIYNQLGQFELLQEAEATAAASLTPLAVDTSLSDTTRIQMIIALAQVDRINSLMAIQARQGIESIRAMHLGFSQADMHKAGSELYDQQRARRGSCVANSRLELG